MGGVVKNKFALHKKLKFSNKDFFSKCEQIHSFLRICSHLLQKSLLENLKLFLNYFLCSVAPVFADLI